jgi:murein DD-endopeptidase MepM/ murein hydrolase activator NlpD
LPFLKTSVLEYQNIKSDKFDGTAMPISFVPNWLDSTYLNKSLRFESIATDAFVEIPRYDADVLRDADPKNRLAVLERSTYITPYMGSYRMNFEEYDGSHLGVDIRAPLGTPVLAVANGVVIRTNDKETADGKYVILRHDAVPVPGGTVNLYSSYLHLESIAVVPGTKIRKGQPIGKVGLTGITTTPHLHFQIDKETAPFHVYWPYSFSDLRDLGIDFFAAVNMGLGKENAIKHTIHPMEFVQDSSSAGASQVAVSTANVAVAAATESSPKNSAPTEPVAPILPPEKLSERPDDLLADVSKPVPVETVAPVEVLPVVAPVVKKEKFSDVPKDSAYRPALERLMAARALESFDADDFRPSDSMTRREAVLVFGALLRFSPTDFPNLPFGDVLPSDNAAGMIDRLLAAKILSSSSSFRPSAPITRAEAAVLLARASGLKPVAGGSFFRDVAIGDTRKSLLNAFSIALKLKKGIVFHPDAPLSRAEFIKMVDVWRTKTGKLR